VTDRIEKFQSRKATPRFHVLGSEETVPTGDYVALVNGTDVPLVPISLPSGLTGRAREKAARLQLCDAVGLSIDQMEIRPFALTGTSPQWSHSFLADPEALANWRAEVAGHNAQGARCLAILPDYLSLPAAEELWVLAEVGTHLCARLGLTDGFSGELHLSEALLTEALAGGAPKAVLIIGAVPESIKVLFQNANVPVVDTEQQVADLGITLTQPLQNGEVKLDLARDGDRALRELWSTLRPALAAVGAFVLGAILWGVGVQIETQSLSAEDTRLRTKAVEVARKNLLPTGPVLDLRTQISTQLAQRVDAAATQTATVSPLDSLNRAASVLMTTGAELRRVDYTRGDGLVLELTVPDFAQLDETVSGLTTAGFTVEIAQSGARAESGVDATVILTGANAQGGGQ